MFGDPVTNEKGWEVKKLGEVCFLKAGKAIKSSDLKEKAKNLYPCYGGNGIRGFIEKISHKEDLPIIGRQGALCGNVNFAKAPFYATEHAVVVSPLIEMNKLWLFWQLKFINLEQYAHGVAQPGIAVNDLMPITFPLPPLPLQQSFASKIEAIERQKALIQQSITETETLFNSRMDYYFD
jgi:type I restriction enzyme S subunit